jgi:hypothetical protein
VHHPDRSRWVALALLLAALLVGTAVDQANRYEEEHEDHHWQILHQTLRMTEDLQAALNRGVAECKGGRG